MCRLDGLPHLTGSRRAASPECFRRWEEGRGERERGGEREERERGGRKEESENTREDETCSTLLAADRLAAELVISTHVSAALCQNTPTVLLQLKKQETDFLSPSLSLSPFIPLSHSCSPFPSLPPSHFLLLSPSLSLSPPLPLSLSLSLSHTHTHSLTLSLTHTHTHSLSLSPPLPLSHTLSLSLD